MKNGKELTVLVPFPGFLYLYSEQEFEEGKPFVLVPFPGFLYLYTPARQ